MTESAGQAMRRQESRIQSLARRHGYAVHRSRRGSSIDNRGEFRLVDVDRNRIVLGEKCDATLDDIDWFLRGETPVGRAIRAAPALLPQR
jgi:hypothetical protein